MDDSVQTEDDARLAGPKPTSRSTDWYADGGCRTVVVGGICVTVRVVGRQGRRTRIEIIGPAGAEFSEISTAAASAGPT